MPPGLNTEALHLEKSFDQQKIFGTNRASDVVTPEFRLGPDYQVISHEKAGDQIPVCVLNNMGLGSNWTSKKNLVVTVLWRAPRRRTGRQRLHTTMQEAMRSHTPEGHTSSAVVTSLGLFSVTHLKHTWEHNGAAQKRSHSEFYWEGSRFWSGLVGGVDDPAGAVAADCG